MWAEYAQNSLRKPFTQLTPFQCVLGFQPPLFPWSGEPTNLPAVDTWLRRSEATWDLAHTNLRQAIQRVTRQANRLRRAAPPYQVGQWVWLSTRDLRLRLPCRKLSPRYVGPFKILRQITPVSFRLDLLSHYRISPTFHVSLLKPAVEPGGEGDQDEAAPAETPPLMDAEESIYQINQILDSRRRGGVLQYLADWEGYGPRSGLGSILRTCSTPNLLLHSTVNTRRNPLLVLVVDPGAEEELTSGAVRRGGALSLIAPLW